MISHKRILVVGLTGGFGTGKTTVAKAFARLGAKVLDADRMAHRLLELSSPFGKAVIRVFGTGIVNNGKVDRKKLANIVFDQPGQLKKLNAIIHPAVVQEIKRGIAAYKERKASGVVVIDAPLLIEVGLHKMVDFTIVVRANRSLQIERVAGRMHINKKEILKRINKQMGIQEKLKKADIVIDNRSGLNDTRKQVQMIWKKFQRVISNNQRGM